jgi:hypothetical protein
MGKIEYDHLSGFGGKLRNPSETFPIWNKPFKHKILVVISPNSLKKFYI